MADTQQDQTETGGDSLRCDLIAQTVDIEGSNDVNTLISLKPSMIGRTPVHVICVVDVSGSMSSSADTANTENTGLTLLDITKHAVKTVIHSLGDNDVVSLVEYTTTAKVTFEGIHMNEDGKKRADTLLDALYPQSSTNIWGGLYEGLEVARREFEKDSSRLASIMLLTDGLPNIRPPRGEEIMLQRYQDEHPAFVCTVNTFGFGYSLDSVLLRNLANQGNGSYAFIPDSGLVGTVFVNTLANCLTTMATNIKLSLEPANGASIKHVFGGYSQVDTQWGSHVNICSATLGQSRDLVVTMECPNGVDATFLCVTVEYLPRGASETVKFTQELNSTINTPEIRKEQLRLEFVETVRDALGLVLTSKGVANAQSLPQARTLVAELLQKATNSGVADDPRMADLIQDITGQVTEALSREEWFTKWGRHYLPSLLRAHMLQQCNNFKDPGVQHYGGDLFKSIRDQSDKVFLDLPAPKPSNVRRQGNRGVGGAPSAPVNMRSYYNSCNPCFDGNNRALMADGSYKYVKDLKKHDQVHTPLGAASIVCVLKTLVAPETELCVVGNLVLTPWHPVKHNGAWTFPDSISPQKTMACESVYSFLLDSNHSMVIEGVEACTLGHGFTENDVIKHAYFGTQRVVDDMRRLVGFEEGLIVFHNECLKRNPDTGLLNGFASEKQVLVC